MNQYVLGYRVYVSEAQANLNPENEQILRTVIESVTASKEALCNFLEENPEATEKEAKAFIDKECSAISAVNDHFGIGIPMNSFRLTLKAAAHYYFNSVVPEVAHHSFRIHAFQKFIHQHQEVLLVFPEVYGLTFTVGDLQFSVNRLNAEPTFLEFVLDDLSKVRMFYTLDSSSIRRLSEYVA